MSEQLYFIAVIPPKEIQEEITSLKELVAERFGSSHALRSPPHITLHMPFKWKDKKEDLLIRVIQEINEQVTPFEVELKDFDYFEPRVVFVDVMENESLAELQKVVVDMCRKELKLDNANYKNRPFHPHMTIAFRDLRKKQFYEAKEYFTKQEVQFLFEVERVELLRHDGKKWEVVEAS